jgi:hypothetical protein
MDSFREAVTWASEGPLTDFGDLPTAILYSVVLVISHAAGSQVAKLLAAHLDPVLGKSEARWSLTGRRLVFPGPPQTEVRPAATKVTFVFRQRLRPKRLRSILDALAELPGARDARLRGQRQRFAEAGSRGGAMMDG